MRLDLVVPNEGEFSQQAVASCPDFEDMGFGGLWFTDHVVGQRAYQPVYGPVWLEIMTAMTWAAANTKTIRLGTGVLVVPYRDPVMTAKQLTTIDVLSGGRVDLGVGTGWSKGEYHALGRGDIFDQRGAVTDESLDVMLRCWEGGEFSWDGQWSNFRRLEFAPTPVQKPRIPLWIGSRGTAPAPLRRVAKYADVWHPTQLSPAELKEGAARVNEMAEREIPTSIRCQYPADTPINQLQDELESYREAGCIQAAVDLKSTSHSELMNAVENLATLISSLK